MTLLCCCPTPSLTPTLVLPLLLLLLLLGPPLLLLPLSDATALWHINLQEREPPTPLLRASPLRSQRFELQPVMVANAIALHLILTTDVVRHSLSPMPPHTPMPPPSYYAQSKLPYPSSLFGILSASLMKNCHWDTVPLLDAQRVDLINLLPSTTNFHVSPCDRLS